MNNNISKVSLVTGAASGIGRASALAFAKAGYCVVVADINEKGGAETVNMISSKLGGEAAFVKCDVSNEAEVRSMLEFVKTKYGALHAAFNNAGIGGVQTDTASCSRESWDQTLAVNLTGTFLCMKYEIPLILESGGGSICNHASTFAKVGNPVLPACCASQFGLVGLTKSAAIDLAPKGIRVNAVCPGFIDTPMINEVRENGVMDVDAMAKAKQPIGRVGQPEEVAAAVVWLSSPEASFVTGTTLDVDGGWLA